MRLIKPSKKYLEQFVKAGNEYKEANITYYKGFYRDSETFIKKCNEYSKGENLASNIVPQTTYWLIDGDNLIGQVDIRHYLNENLLLHGGNIGYGIRTPYQNKGYGTKMLELALKKCKLLKLDKVLITCIENNIASAKVIEKNGGVLENKINMDNNIYCRYWITIK